MVEFGHARTWEGRETENITLCPPFENVCRDISRRVENRLKQEITLWTADYNWVPRPMSNGQLYFLVFFSGHRRWGDIQAGFTGREASLQWQSIWLWTAIEVT